MRTIGIIGGGASGIAAAISAAESNKGVKVILLEHKDKIGKKILSTGNGRCNLTNELMNSDCFRSCEMHAVQEVLGKFGYQDTLDFFEKLGLLMKSRNGYIYPRCDQAAAVLQLLQMELERLGVEVHTGVHVSGISRSKKGFTILTDQNTFRADKVILATGGKAAKVLGSDGSGYSLAKSMGHSLVPVVPALVQLKAAKHPLAKASGVRTDVTVTAIVGGNEVAQDTGELQITAYGISGIPVFQISRYIAMALYEKREAQVAVDFLPAMDENQFYTFLKKRLTDRAALTAEEYLAGVFHTKLIPELLKAAGIRSHTQVKKLSEADLKNLAHQCKHMMITIADTNGFDNAQVCAGGVNLNEIDCQTMESRYVDGFYLTGELLDVDGICGGYNLQWAWATGVIAGRHAAR